MNAINGEIKIYRHRKPIPGKQIKASLSQPGKIEIEFIATVIFNTEDVLVLDILSSDNHQVLTPGQRLDVPQRNKKSLS
jgi:hypothetical protein